MSLLMEALKKAELAKRKAAEAGNSAAKSPQASVPDIAPTQVPAPESLALELAPADPPRTEPKTVTAAESPAPTARQEPVADLAASKSADAPRVEAPAAPQPTVPRNVPVAAPTMAPPRIESVVSKSTPTEFASTATTRPRGNTLPRAQRNRALYSGLATGLLFAFCAGGYLYYRSMSEYLQQQTTLGVTQSPLAAAPEAAQVAAPPVPESKPTVARKVATVKPVAKSPIAAAQAHVSKIATAPPSAEGATPALVLADAPAVASPPTPEPTPIAVTKDGDQNQVFAGLQQAYRAYLSGDDVRAQVLYAQVLNQEENNRDALLGMAAIAVRHKDYAKAQEIYSELLTLDPKDSVAQAGFVSVSSSFDPLEQEARVKTLLDHEPNAPHLLFTYANMLMQQQRWSEAARALFSAYQAKGDNPDYAFNLAVSLDHLGQTDGALKYYRVALGMSERQHTNFRADDVRRRIAMLQAPGEGAPQ